MTARKLAITLPPGTCHRGARSGLAQAWRGGPRQARLTRLLNSNAVEVVPLDDLTARAAGVLCGKAGTSDVMDASVVLCARERGHSAVLCEPDDLARLDPTLHLVQP